MLYVILFLAALLPDATPVPNPINANPPDLSWLGPTIGACGVVIVSLIGVLSLIIGKRQDRKNAKAAALDSAELGAAPKVTDGWEEVRLARADATKYYNLYRAFENIYYTVASALRHLGRSIHETHPDMVFEKDVTDALAIVPPDTSDATK